MQHASEGGGNAGEGKMIHSSAKRGRPHHGSSWRMSNTGRSERQGRWPRLLHLGLSPTTDTEWTKHAVKVPLANGRPSRRPPNCPTPDVPPGARIQNVLAAHVGAELKQQAEILEWTRSASLANMLLREVRDSQYKAYKVLRLRALRL